MSRLFDGRSRHPDVPRPSVPLAPSVPRAPAGTVPAAEYGPPSLPPGVGRAPAGRTRTRTNKHAIVNVRMPPKLKAKLAALAAELGMSLNALMTHAALLALRCS